MGTEPVRASSTRKVELRDWKNLQRSLQPRTICGIWIRAEGAAPRSKCREVVWEAADERLFQKDLSAERSGIHRGLSSHGQDVG